MSGEVEAALRRLTPYLKHHARRLSVAFADDLLSEMYMGLVLLARRNPERFGWLMNQSLAYIAYHCEGHYALPYLRKEERRWAEAYYEGYGGQIEPRLIKVRAPGQRARVEPECFTLTATEWRTHLHNLGLDPLEVEQKLMRLPGETRRAAVLLLCGFSLREAGRAGKRARWMLRAA